MIIERKEMTMRTFAQNPRATQQATFANSTIPGRARFGQNCEMNSAPTLQRSIGNQAVQHLLAARARDVRGDSPAIENSRFGHDFSRIAVNDSQARASTAPKELASLRPCDMEGVEEAEGAEELDQAAGVPMPAPSPAAAPPAPSPAAAPPAPIPVPAPVAALNVTVPPHVRSASTPLGMPDRIPPRVDTPVAVGITGWHPPMLPVALSIEGAGGGNGTATIDGAATVDLASSAAVLLRGVDQTDVGKAGNLKLIADQGGTRLAASNSFSVSAIPQNHTIAFNCLVPDSGCPSMLPGDRRGFKVRHTWESDSKDPRDLAQTDISERVEVDRSGGSLAGGSLQTSGYLGVGTTALVDEHTVGVGDSGFQVLNQTQMFKDNRTGAADIPMTNSGYRISHSILPKPGTGFLGLFRDFEITTTKFGFATTALGVSSGAGSGSVTRTQDV
jgi:hypothetical protein